jgi:hypothetical protein
VTTFIDGLKDELYELSLRYAKLSLFVVSDAFETLQPEQRRLLLEQCSVMATYKRILVERLDLIEAEQ